MKNLLFAIGLSVLAMSCTESAREAGQEETLSEIKGAASKNSNIVRNNITAENKAIDTVNVAKITFEKEKHNFGEVKEGAKVSYTYKFKNTGKVDLLISNARSTCGCTVPDWPKNPIAPGETGEIDVTFNTSGKKNRQSKPVTITANTYPQQTRVYIEGNVIPDAKKEAERRKRMEENKKKQREQKIEDATKGLRVPGNK